MISRHIARTSVALIAVAAMAGCTTMQNGTHQGVKLTSSVPNTHINLDGKAVGDTPKTVQMGRGSGHKVTFTHAGYQPLTEKFTRRRAKSILHELAQSGIVGMTVDSLDGANGVLSPKKYHAVMVPLRSTATSNATAASESGSSAPLGVSDTPQSDASANGPASMTQTASAPASAGAENASL